MLVQVQVGIALIQDLGGIPQNSLTFLIIPHFRIHRNVGEVLPVLLHRLQEGRYQGEEGVKDDELRQRAR
ncbi:MAG: hypothetical protein K6E61_08650 [Bacteroidales bacterium]|nr:hypothetical protein [Bacteroidales bacterium]